MQDADHRLAGIGSHLCQSAFQAFSGRSESAKRIVDADAPVSAGDNLAEYCSAVLRQSGLVQTEGELDDVRNALAGRAFALLIFKRIRVAACGRCRDV
jgi:hypothetical protein